ncbi:glycosyltransferase [Pontibacter oryzae]|uniref:Glycosyltransferase n=1 Tax=Pontibacter oryzae TaxID=2304593 RepID=A0A399SLE9_9BACT|nr:glycosyltransferase [Pontibacter oryzae]RIJ42777.1 glycosyltransferase [Pontibacter oryzae]
MNRIKQVSVCIITYNHKNFIAQAIEGALNQVTNGSIEIIIGDDCSTDGTSDICLYYADKYKDKIKYYRSPTNIGMVGNWIDTIKKCEGKYIALCEGDDYWIDKYKLQKQVQFLNEHNDYVIAFHDCRIVDEYNKIVKEERLGQKCKKILSSENIISGQLIPTNTVLFRNGLIEEYPDTIKDVPNVDIFIFALLGQYGKAKFVEGIAHSAYRVHSGGVWSLQNEKYKQLQILKTYEKLLLVIDQKYKNLIKTKIFARKVFLSKNEKDVVSIIKSYIKSYRYFNLSAKLLKSWVVTHYKIIRR